MRDCLQVEKVSLKAKIGPYYLLQDVSFQVFPGDRIAIIGSTGAGKTSLLRLLNRLNEPTSGQIYLDRQDYRQISPTILRRRVHLLLQEPKLLGMSVKEALAYPLKLEKLDPSVIQQRLVNILQQLHIPNDWLERTEVQLSVGQRQLVAIARSLLIQPQILLLDEPTSALDRAKADTLVQLLQQLTDSGTMTVLMVNHQLDVVQKFANRVLYLEKGRLTADLTREEIDWSEISDRLTEAEAKAAQEWE
ncbi:ABC transporter ATP-binding protein [Merismopedia glauca]|uniref:Cobalt ABC transporter n=1 Tax=Merismopedia glauca CCAP 1448/3 TaxID=1296344 RepID=A0A2T1C9F1_9CYAN|nr:ATP-binding cassette domain-containing protein [Merismopedia glauca]PSB04871.1 cobalt ABC transporter [Merismopedia glauca CCAP 1448/3]